MELKRTVDPETLAAMSEPVTYPILFAFVDWPDAPVYAHTATGIITWGGHEWVGVGTLGEITIPPENAGLAMVEAVLSLVGVPEDLAGHYEGNARNRLVEIFIGFADSKIGGYDGEQPVTGLRGQPANIFTGIVDMVAMITESNGKEGVMNKVSVTINTGEEARAAMTIYHNDENQKANYPNDTAGRLVVFSYAKAQKLTWPEN